MKKMLGVMVSLVFGLTVGNAKDVPRGYEPVSELAQAQAEAGEKGRLLVVVVKGSDDACPRCAAAMENGEKAVGSGVVKVFARAKEMNENDSSAYPEALKKRAAQKFTDGAAVTFLVFNPDMTELLAQAGRKELEDDKKATAEFKKAIGEHKRALKK